MADTCSLYQSLVTRHAKTVFYIIFVPGFHQLLFFVYDRVKQWSLSCLKVWRFPWALHEYVSNPSDKNLGSTVLATTLYLGCHWWFLWTYVEMPQGIVCFWHVLRIRPVLNTPADSVQTTCKGMGALQFLFARLFDKVVERIHWLLPRRLGIGGMVWSIRASPGPGLSLHQLFPPDLSARRQGA